MHHLTPTPWKKNKKNNATVTALHSHGRYWTLLLHQTSQSKAMKLIITDWRKLQIDAGFLVLFCVQCSMLYLATLSLVFAPVLSSVLHKPHNKLMNVAVTTWTSILCKCCRLSFGRLGTLLFKLKNSSCL